MKQFFISTIMAIVFIFSGCLFLTPELRQGVICNEKNIRTINIADNIYSTYKIIYNPVKKNIFALSSQKILIVDTAHFKEKTITYELPGNLPNLIFLRNKFTIINSGFDVVGGMNEIGKLIWEYPRNPGEVIPYDIEAWKLVSGGVEYYVATASRGVHVLNENGRFLRQIGSGYIAGIEFCKYGKDDAIIAQALPKRQFYIWDFDGKIKKKLVTKKSFVNFTIINWPGDYNILVDDGKRFYVLDFNGEILFECENGVPIQNLRGTGVYLEKGLKYFAVITSSRLPDSLSILRIFNPNGEMVYKEVICRTVALQAVKDELSDREYLLVGDCKIRKYQMP
ncbi:MAG: hypothetical protein WBM78_25455 [Desulfobacterales bacterium]